MEMTLSATPDALWISTNREGSRVIPRFERQRGKRRVLWGLLMFLPGDHIGHDLSCSRSIVNTAERFDAAFLPESREMVWLIL